MLIVVLGSSKKLFCFWFLCLLQRAGLAFDETGEARIAFKTGRDSAWLQLSLTDGTD